MFFLGKWQGRLTLSLWREYPVTWCHYTQDSYENKPQKHLCGSRGLKNHVSWVTGICSKNVRIESGGRILVERAMRSTLLLRRRSPGKSPTISPHRASQVSVYWWATWDAQLQRRSNQLVSSHGIRALMGGLRSIELQSGWSAKENHRTS